SRRRLERSKRVAQVLDNRLHEGISRGTPWLAPSLANGISDYVAGLPPIPAARLSSSALDRADLEQLVEIAHQFFAAAIGNGLPDQPGGQHWRLDHASSPSRCSMP